MSTQNRTFPGVDARHLWILVATLATVASITGLTNGFAFDDVQVIVKDPRLHTLADAWMFFTQSYWRAELGSSLYRPLTMLVFAIQWVAGGGHPLVFHATSIALYAALSVAVYSLARLIVNDRAAFIAAAIFAVHPVHVEAVANVVGQAELWTALILVVLVTSFIRIRRSGSMTGWQVARFGLGYLVACGFKEHAVVLPALLVAAELLVVKPDTSGWQQRAKQLLPLVAVLVFAGAAFVAARFLVLHALATDSTAAILRHQPFTTRFFTMLSVVVEWVRLFFWPMSLSADYSYPRLRSHTGFELSMLPAVAVIAGVAWLGWSLRKRSAATTFGISWAGIGLLIPSNLIVVTGFVLAERTLLLASIGFAICFGIALDVIAGWVSASGLAVRRAPMFAFTGLVLLFAGRSLTRNPVWRDNDTLFAQTIEDVPSSHRAHWMRAVDLAENDRQAEALDEMDLAVALSDNNDALLLAYGGDMFATAGRCPRAVVLYRRALELAPGNVQLRANTSWCLLRLGKPEEAKRIALEAGAKSADSRLQKLIHEADTISYAVIAPSAPALHSPR